VSSSVDVAVAGAGHNSLVAAAYLTRAGRRCRVLDARPVPGGGVASEELLLPGYRLDSCSAGHTLIQANPLLADDEPGLLAEHGLEYIEPDPVGYVVFPDGRSLTMWLDLERTYEEIARYSRADAESYRRPLAYSIAFGRQRRSWTIPRGGSGELARALAEVIEDGGGEVLCERRVVGLVLEDGRCAGVETEDGERHLAREAVLSTIHVKDLLRMAPLDAWGDDFVYGIETYDEGVAAFAAHYVTTEPPRYPLRDGGELTAVSSGVAGWPEEIVRMGRDVKEGTLVHDGAWLLFPTPTVADPSRAPEGCHTVKILGMQPYDPGGGPERWEDLRAQIAAEQLAHLRRAAPNMVPETIVAELIVAPPDLERSNPQMWHGVPRR
jgi:phytoene dehydrogenase-like protein